MFFFPFLFLEAKHHTCTTFSPFSGLSQLAALEIARCVQCSIVDTSVSCSMSRRPPTASRRRSSDGTCRELTSDRCSLARLFIAAFFFSLLEAKCDGAASSPVLFVPLLSDYARESR